MNKIALPTSEKPLNLNSNNKEYAILLQAFIGSVIKEDDTIVRIRTKYDFGLHAWNAALIQEKSEKAYFKYRKDFLEPMLLMQGVSGFFDSLVDLKNEKFNKHKDLIIDVEVFEDENSGYFVTVDTSSMNY